jgi:two-component system, OmpR family, response regulator
MRVLVVEDELRMATLLERGLRDDGYAVDVATNGADGLWMGTENDYAAVVLDVMLPEIDGFTVCRRLRELGRWPPVLMLTARSAIEDKVGGLDVGADDYLVKPFSFAELSARVRALVRRRSGERPTVLEVGDLRLDPATHRAWADDAELSLSPKEMSLLELLMRHPEEVVTRTRISTTCGTSPTTDSRTWSSNTSPTCAARSTSRSGATTSRPSEGSATDFAPR